MTKQYVAIIQVPVYLTVAVDVEAREMWEVGLAAKILMDHGRLSIPDIVQRLSDYAAKIAPDTKWPLVLQVSLAGRRRPDHSDRGRTREAEGGRSDMSKKVDRDSEDLDIQETTAKAMLSEVIINNPTGRHGEPRAEVAYVEAAVPHDWEKRRAELGNGPWQPISTAPKDGTLIDVWLALPNPRYNRRLTDVVWAAKLKCWWRQQNEVGEGWRVERDGAVITHWMRQPGRPA